MSYYFAIFTLIAMIIFLCYVGFNDVLTALRDKKRK